MVSCGWGWRGNACQPPAQCPALASRSRRSVPAGEQVLSPHVVVPVRRGEPPGGPSLGREARCSPVLGAQRSWRRLPQAEPPGTESRRGTAWEASAQTNRQQGVCLFGERKGPLSSGPAPGASSRPGAPAALTSVPGWLPATCDPSAAWAGPALTPPGGRPRESSCGSPKAHKLRAGAAWAVAPSHFLFLLLSSVAPLLCLRLGSPRHKPWTPGLQQGELVPPSGGGGRGSTVY